MANGWYRAYTRLVDFVIEHPEIEIGENVVSIPEDVRSEFYRLFDGVRAAFVGENFSELLDEAEFLSVAYSKIEMELRGLLDLNEILMPDDLQRFLHDPLSQLIREIFDPLFDLLKRKYLFSLGPEYRDHLIDGPVSVELKNVFDEHGQPLSGMAATTRKDAKSWAIRDGNKEFLIEDAGMQLSIYKRKIDIEKFKVVASTNIDSSFKKLYRQGYKKWVVLSLVGRLEPDKMFHIPLRQPTSREIIKHRVEATELVPPAEESKSLGFEVGGSEILLVPDFIVHSAKLNRYVAVRTEMGKAIWPTSGLSEGREWYSISSIIEEYGVVELRPDLMIYVDNRPDDISLVADSKNICRPDLVIQCVDRLTWEHNSWCRDLEKIKSYSEILKPAFGAFMVSKDHVPENRRKIMGESIPLLEVGFNQFRLDPILDVLRQ